MQKGQIKSCFCVTQGRRRVCLLLKEKEQRGTSETHRGSGRAAGECELEKSKAVNRKKQDMTRPTESSNKEATWSSHQPAPRHTYGTTVTHLGSVTDTKRVPAWHSHLGTASWRENRWEAKSWPQPKYAMAEESPGQCWLRELHQSCETET